MIPVRSSAKSLSVAISQQSFSDADGNDVPNVQCVIRMPLTARERKAAEISPRRQMAVNGDDTRPCLGILRHAERQRDRRFGDNVVSIGLGSRRSWLPRWHATLISQPMVINRDEGSKARPPSLSTDDRMAYPRAYSRKDCRRPRHHVWCLCRSSPPPIIGPSAGNLVFHQYDLRRLSSPLLPVPPMPSTSDPCRSCIPTLPYRTCCRA